MEGQVWPEESLILGRSGTQYVTMITFIRTSYRKESNMSDTDWLRYLFPSYLIKILLAHHLANLNISIIFI